MLSRRSRSWIITSATSSSHSRREADDVLEQMLYECLSRFGSVSVGDLYEATGIQTSHVDYKWGWTSLDGGQDDPEGKTVRYMLDLPEPDDLELRRFPCPTSNKKRGFVYDMYPYQGLAPQGSTRCRMPKSWLYILREQNKAKEEAPDEETKDNDATASPSDPQPEEPRISRPLPCPGCGSTKGSARMGTFRSQCLNCNGLPTRTLSSASTTKNLSRSPE
jgi:hypothetical protein